jgi:hypothetical protein
MALTILLRDPFTPDDFEAFISERQRTIQDAIENLLIKDRLDLTPQLSELDSKVEAVELRLRELIFTTLGGDETLLPSHVVQKVKTRISAALKKNAAMDADRYATLAGMLEYFDLREVEDTVVTNSLWQRFPQWSPQIRPMVVTPKPANGT